MDWLMKGWKDGMMNESMEGGCMVACIDGGTDG